MYNNAQIENKHFHGLHIYRKYKLAGSGTFDEFKSTPWWGFPGGSVGKNPPANAKDMGLIPGLGRPHMPWNS